MDIKDISELLKQKFQDQIIETKIDGQVNPFIKVVPNSIKEVVSFLCYTPELKFDYLNCLSGVDYGKGILGVVYHISSITHKHNLTLKVEVPIDNPKIPSVEKIWKTANWHEREAYDLFGIIFDDHSDLRRILLPEDWEGYPLRKDYKTPETYHGMKVPY